LIYQAYAGESCALPAARFTTHSFFYGSIQIEEVTGGNLLPAEFIQQQGTILENPPSPGKISVDVVREKKI
jgi:hypothetical protein